MSTFLLCIILQACWTYVLTSMWLNVAEQWGLIQKNAIKAPQFKSGLFLWSCLLRFFDLHSIPRLPRCTPSWSAHLLDFWQRKSIQEVNIKAPQFWGISQHLRSILGFCSILQACWNLSQHAFIRGNWMEKNRSRHTSSILGCCCLVWALFF